MKKVAFMFPGQGSQAVGMGQSFYDEYQKIRELYDEANSLLKKDITKIMFEGPKEILTETENTQPALLLSSIAVHTLLIEEEIQPVMTVGHSLGEYSALVAAGAISLEEALPLVATRGKLMEEAFPKGQGTMAAVLGMNEEKIQDCLNEVEDEIVDIANLNCPGQIVISGSKEGIEEATEVLKANGAKRVMPLNVSGPFHSRLMKSANEKFSNHLNEVHFSDTSIPVYANVSASPVTEHQRMKELLIKQLYSPVRFEESIRKMIEAGVDAFVEVGNGKVLSGLVRKIDKQAKTFAVQDKESLQEFVTWYKGEA
ncbi:ACP S-malonyltransferase [Virgibacillus halodenitrificans]|uniref:Malonyl CoA-acyl carrier protein transacylase n=1 Tax=Virgibacillus halodenitrificans TaxID=1482 RepID=A0ABR7VU16_VIRHA|nr:ACP S-malonyltransferase [Virgibacillus halodenitrificans]MBD1224463.1 ACP S-malonyltransferase [Virgibacillus halodenitrificans]MCJ0931241.1 ACP S-malonyltransferase [Virgibacillus halodenitrificans]MYL45927.1 ACP S-malonyltransferase [Virgibacillus halodenitrificans]MYL56422.1 ACP S-malonyltransferase [Virgibacillus halodenitrificans]WHX27130.1 ACP S-malonyltransferase [Virgibacillus halodenitrificans]